MQRAAVRQRTDQSSDSAHDAGQGSWQGSMSSLSESDREAVRHERAVSSLSDRSGAPRAQVRSLFAQEFSRLELGAKVRAYLGALTASNVRRMLHRKARSAQEDSRVRPGGAKEAEVIPPPEERPAP
jgi:hypothetical protein